MRYAPEHKEETRRRIVTMAGRLFRKHGYDGVGIDQIMAAANLTRGGFYGYFKSKKDLFTAVVDSEHDFNMKMATRTGASKEELVDEAMEIVGGYLDIKNRTIVGQGCTMAALSVDVARADRSTKKAYTAFIKDLTSQFNRTINESDPVDERGLLCIATCVGGLTIARSMSDDKLAEKALNTCRDQVIRILEEA